MNNPESLAARPWGSARPPSGATPRPGNSGSTRSPEPQARELVILQHI
ncbi:MAG: hypothetical protein N3C58_04310 [Meiothermus ruber]|nr:hypothetical protein [Meiothermus ruber]